MAPMTNSRGTFYLLAAVACAVLAAAIAHLLTPLVQRAALRHGARHVDASAPRVDQRTDFDYFPSHYRNQATEPAEPIATF